MTEHPSIFDSIPTAAVTGEHLARALHAREQRIGPFDEANDEVSIAMLAAAALAYKDANAGIPKVTVADRHIDRALSAIGHLFRQGNDLDIIVQAGAVIAHMEALRSMVTNKDILPYLADEVIGDHLKIWAKWSYGLTDPLD